MEKLYNLTAHDQSPYIEQFKELGFELVNPEPRVKGTRPDLDSQIEEGKRVARAIPENASVLIGGAQLIMESIIYELARKKCRFFTALSERVMDARGHFIFNLKSVSETYFSRLIKAGKIKIE